MHTFQGATVGPTRKGKPQNQFECIICDPGDKRFEGNNCGMLYTTISRGTELMENEDKTTSAIYFTGHDMTFGRVANLFLGREGKKFKKIQRREEWVKYLDAHQTTKKFTKREKQAIKKWFESNPITPNQLDDIITKWNRKQK